MKKSLYILFALFLTIPSFSGDLLRLSNEMVFEGKVIKIKDCSIVFKIERKKYFIPASEIFSIQFENTKNKIYKNYLTKIEEDTTTSAGACLKGQRDATKFHGKKGGHFVLGLLFGPVAIIGTALANPSPKKGMNTHMKSTNNEQFSDPAYISCYTKRARGSLIPMEILGFVVSTFTALIVLNQN